MNRRLTKILLILLMISINRLESLLQRKKERKSFQLKQMMISKTKETTIKIYMSKKGINLKHKKRINSKSLRFSFAAASFSLEHFSSLFLSYRSRYSTIWLGSTRSSPKNKKKIPKIFPKLFDDSCCACGSKAFEEEM